MANPISIYVFRDPHFSPAGDTVVSAAPLDAVIAVYGGGGIKQTAGISAAFGGAAIYGNETVGKENYCVGVWGERKASKFRQSFRSAGIDVEIINSPPPGRLIWWQTK